MPFTVSYTGSTTEYRVAASTPENKEEDFYKRMNELSSNKELDEEEILNLMVQECEEYFDFDKRIEGFGELDYEEFNSYSDIEVDGKKMTAKITRIPNLSEVPYPVQMEPNLVVEFYSRN